MKVQTNCLSICDYQRLLFPYEKIQSRSPVKFFVYVKKGKQLCFVLLQRIIYYVSHRFKAFPSNRLLFTHFKNYQFDQIQTVEEYEKIQLIFRRFLSLKRFQGDLKEIEQKLICIKQKLAGPKEKHIKEDSHAAQEMPKREIVSLKETVSLIEPSPASPNNELALAVIQPVENPAEAEIEKQLSLAITTLDQSSLALKVEKYLKEKQAWKESYQSWLVSFSLNAYKGFKADEQEICGIKKLIESLNRFWKLYEQLKKIDQEQYREMSQLFLQFLLRCEKICLFLKEVYLEKNHEDLQIQDHAKEILVILYQHLASNSEQNNLGGLFSIAHLQKSVRHQIKQLCLYPFKDSDKEEHIKWKIDKYDVLLTQLKMEFNRYIQSIGFRSLEAFIQSPHTRLEWEKIILPIFNLFIKKLQLERAPYTLDRLEHLRKCYKDEFLPLLREAVQWSASHAEAQGREHIFAFCHIFYTKINLNRYAHEMLDVFCSSSTFKKVVSQDHDVKLNGFLIQNLENIYKTIANVPRALKGSILAQYKNSLVGHFNGFQGFVFDSNQNNIPHIFTDLVLLQNGEKRIVSDVAMGTPTIESGGTQAARLAPEFWGYQQANKQKGQKHLYINHQDFRPKTRMAGNENPRCAALHDLGNNAELRETFYVITLSNDSPFYWQDSPLIIENDALVLKKHLVDTALKDSFVPSDYKNQRDNFEKICQGIANFIHAQKFQSKKAFSKEETVSFAKLFYKKVLTTSAIVRMDTFGYSPYLPKATAFKKELLRQFFDMPAIESGNYISDVLIKQLNLKEWAEKAIQHIHCTFFEQKEDLTLEEGRVWIEAFHILLSLKLMIDLKVDYYNKSCKDRIDRGAAADALLFGFLAILNQVDSQEEVRKFFEMMIFSRSLMVRKRTIIEKRLLRLIETMKWMLDHKEEVRQLYQNVFPNTTITTTTFLELGQKKNSKKELEISTSDFLMI